MTDLESFALAFAIVWGGLAAYLLRLRRVAGRLDARLKALEERQR